MINSVKGYGLLARRPIKKGELAATYSGDVQSLSQISKYGNKETNAYTFDLTLGPHSASSYVVYPKFYASVGFFMNHSNKKPNVITKVVLERNGPIILMLALRKIEYGEELTYNYNGEVNNYPTKGFE